MDCPLHDSVLRVHYKGMLLNEAKTVFYDTKVDNNGQPLEFSSGEGLVSSLFLIKHNLTSFQSYLLIRSVLLINMSIYQ